MEQMIRTYNVRVVRANGANPITGQILEGAEEEMKIDAVNLQQAHRIAQLKTTLEFLGQVMRIYIDDDEHLDEKV